MNNYQLNVKQTGEGLELLSSLGDSSVSLVFFDPQYEPVRQFYGLIIPFTRKAIIRF